MATGGTIPKNRTQTVSFYNTTSIIEKQKNIYYVPRFSKTSATVGQEVRTAYLNAFEVVCPPSSVYDDVDVSSWSPQDRTLTIKGNVDNFRLVTDEGACLNYFIITRKVYSSELEYKVYYYAFFITGVEQIGGSSVRLTIEPDDFTNVFYLHNKHVLTLPEISGDYEPFNEKMTNCYVNRQHYNRIKFVQVPIYSTYATHLMGTGSFSVQVTMLTPLELNLNNLTPHYEITGGGSGGVSITDITDRTVTVQFSGGGSSIAVVTIWVTGTATDSHEDNLNIFLNQEESYRFKYQFRQYRHEFPINDSSTSPKRISFLANNTSDFSTLSNDYQETILKNSITYYVLETKSLDSLRKVNVEGLDGVLFYYYNMANTEFVKKGVRRSSPLLLVPFIDIPEEYKFTGYRPKIMLKIIFNNATRYFDPDESWELIDYLLPKLHKNNMDTELNALYCSRNVPLDSSILEVDTQNQIIYFRVTIPYNYNTQTTQEKNIYPAINKAYLVGLVSDKSLESQYIELVKDPNITDYPDNMLIEETGAIPAIMVSKSMLNSVSLNFEKSIYSINLKTDYFDPVLEAEPYTFYSLSYQSNEVTLSKARYYNNFIVKEEISSAFNGMSVMSVLPTYNVEGVETKYINEALVISASETLPLINDAYLTYYYQNMAQMKNQFAVNNFNRGTDLAQHFLVSGPNAVGYTASRRGGYGALAETANQVMEMLNEGIDWQQSNKQIEMNQKSKLADMGRVPDTISQSGTELYSSLLKNEYSLKLNYYRIDEVSYNSIAKLLERTGYQVNLYDTLHINDRVGWNYIRLNGFDFKPTTDIMTSQENSIRKIFSEGVTLLHNKTYLTSGHNYETILED